MPEARVSAPKGSSTARSRMTADTMRTARSGHQATASPPLPSCQVCMQRPVATSHTRAVSSREADASHCPLLSTATLVTCVHWQAVQHCMTVGKVRITLSAEQTYTAALLLL